MKNFELYVALRYLRSRRKEVFISIITIFSILGVALSVMVLNIVLAVMTGFETQLQEKLVDANAHVTVRRYGGPIEDYGQLVKKLEKIDGVNDAYPYTYNQAMLTTPLGSRGLIIRGVAETGEPRAKIEKILVDPTRSDDLFRTAPVEIRRPDGSYDTVQLPSLVLGFSLARDLNIPLGVPVTMFSPELTSSPQGLIPTVKRMVPVAEYRSGLREYETGLAYMSIEAAQKFFGMGAAVSGIELNIEDLFAAPAIGKLAMQSIDGEMSGLYVSDWTEQNRGLWEAIQLEKRVYFIVLQLLVLIASFSIVSTLVMLVMEKSRDIAILKTMGASDRSILRIFLAQGVIIGSSGILLGTLFGYLGCIGLRAYKFEINEDIFSLSHVPVHMEPANFALIAAAAFVVTALAGLYPARRAAKLRPADVLRFE